MANNIYNPGLYHAGAYIASGRPFGATGSLTSESEIITFPHVTKEVTVLNRHGAGSLYVYFHTGSATSNKFLITAGNQQTFPVKSDKIILSASQGVTATYTLYASLTGITSSYMYSLTGSGVTE
tara:strand:- start:12261 stop:12632 length:372 start_codon:yes stop_codon:yes gene_type:complete